MSDKREKIIAAAITLFHQQGFWNTSTASISKEAGVAAGTLFRYFATKEQLIDELFLEVKQEVADYMYMRVDSQADCRSKLWQIWSAYVEWNLKNAEKFRVLEQLEVASRISNSVQLKVVGMNQLTIQIYKEAIQEGLISDYPLDFLAHFIGASSTNVIKLLLDSPKKSKQKQTELMEIGFESFWGGIGG